VWGMPDSLVPGTVSFDPKPRIFAEDFWEKQQECV
jgi:hypothetical protein